jgi:hypothetical protein
MNTRHLLRRFFGLFLAALLLPGIALVSSTTAQAQGRVIIVRSGPRFHHFGYWDPYWGYPYGSPYRYSYYNQYVFGNGETAERQGYHDGFKTGSSDARHHESFNPERSHYYHDAGFGNFAEMYREGFDRGYREAYRS